MARYVLSHPRVVWEFEMQGEIKQMRAFSDADWAGCRRARKSTSGGSIHVGLHCIKTWSKTQAVIAKSSAESELYAVVKTACESLGMLSLLADFGEEYSATLLLDSSAAKGILERTGLTKVRHIDVNLLWLQEQAARDFMNLTKVDGNFNNADLMTKHLNKDKIEGHMQRMNLKYMKGRATIAAKLQSVKAPGARAKAERCNLAVLGARALREVPHDEGGGDRWSSRGADKRWVREHRSARLSLFTPCKVPRGPTKPAELQGCRTTRGVFADGSIFVLRDDWRDHEPHRLMPQAWTGTTTFEAC